MPASDQDDDLSGNCQVVLVLRLVLDRQAQLRYGQLLDAGAIEQGRFATLAGLADAVSRWLERQQRETSLHVDPTT